MSGELRRQPNAGSARAALVDFQVSLEDLIAEEDKVVARWTTRGGLINVVGRLTTSPR